MAELVIYDDTVNERPEDAPVLSVEMIEGTAWLGERGDAIDFEIQARQREVQS